MAVGVAVRPAIHGDRLDVARRIEAPRRQDAPELIPDSRFEVLEGRG